MPSRSKLDACSNRYAHQITKLQTFVLVVQTPIQESGKLDVVHTLRELVTVTVVAHLEEFLNCAVGLAAFHREEEFRDFLAAHGNDHEKAVSATCNLGELMLFARRRISFKERAKKLDRICQFLFQASPWPDEDTQRYLLDLVRVRNIIVHDGGWPTEQHARDVETPGVIVPSNKFFWKLNLDQFIGPALAAAAMVGVTLTNVFQQHPKFKL